MKKNICVTVLIISLFTGLLFNGGIPVASAAKIQTSNVAEGEAVWYDLTVSTPGVVSIDAWTDGKYDQIHLYLYCPRGKQVAEYNESTVRGTGKASLTYNANEIGTYKVKVYLYDAYNDGTRTITVLSSYPLELVRSITYTSTPTPVAPTPPATPPLPIGSEINWVMIFGIGALILLGIIVISKLRPKKEKDDKSTRLEKINPDPTIPSTFPADLKPIYTEIEYLGEGRFARVFRGKRKDDGKVVAVKIPKSLDEITGRSFLREIKAWEEMKHPNIVELYNMNIMPLPYFEMEYVDNKSVEELKKPVEVEKAARIVFNIAEGLKYAHAKGVIHRDLKPQNVLLTKDIVPKITDWGLSKVIAEGKTSSVVGFSPVYAAPEQVSPKWFGRTDERTDIHQLGVIFYELVTGKLPYSGISVAEIIAAIINEKPSINIEAKDVEDIILKCLAKNPGERYQSAEELQKAIAEYLEQEHRKSLKETQGHL